MKKLFLTIGFLVLLLGCYFFPYSSDIVSQKFQPAILQQDFQVFRNLLEKAHPGLYTYSSKEEMDKDFDSVFHTLQTPIDIRAFHQKLSFLVDKIGCSHTNVYLPKPYYDTILKRSNFFPIPIIYVDGGLYINSDNWKIPVGSHILSINGNSAADIMTRIIDYNVPDGFNKNYNLSQAAVEFAYDYFLAYGPVTHFQVEYSAPDSPKKETATIEASTLEKHLNEYSYNSYFSYPAEVGYDFEIVDSIHAGLLTLRSFSYGTASTFAAYKNFLNNAFTLLRNTDDVHNLIIDCRNNTGGDYESVFLLYRYLATAAFKELDSATVKFDKVPFTNYLEPEFALNEKSSLDAMIKQEFCRLPDGSSALKEEENTIRRPFPLSFRGKVYVITNNNVLSAASNFVAMMKDSRRATIVGEETGGGYNGHNGFTRVLYQLPGTAVQLEFSAIRVQHYLERPNLNQYGILPDYPVSNTLDDIINNQDPQLSFIINNLLNTSN